MDGWMEAGREAWSGRGREERKRQRRPTAGEARKSGREGGREASAYTKHTWLEHRPPARTAKAVVRLFPLGYFPCLCALLVVYQIPLGTKPYTATGLNYANWGWPPCRLVITANKLPLLPVIEMGVRGGVFVATHASVDDAGLNT